MPGNPSMHGWHASALPPYGIQSTNKANPALASAFFHALTRLGLSLLLSSPEGHHPLAEKAKRSQPTFVATVSPCDSLLRPRPPLNIASLPSRATSDCSISVPAFNLTVSLSTCYVSIAFALVSLDAIPDCQCQHSVWLFGSSARVSRRIEFASCLVPSLCFP